MEIPSIPWLRGRFADLALLLLGAGLGLGVYTFTYAGGQAYLSNDPKACTQCHVMEEFHDSWQKSSHRSAAACNDCHLPHGFVTKWLAKGENGFFHSLYFTFNNYPDPIKLRERHKGMVLANCRSCHDGLTADVCGPRSNWKEPLDCLRCHNGVAHGATR